MTDTPCLPQITKNNRVKRAMKVSTGNVASSTSEESPLQQLRIEGHLLPRSLHCLLSLMTAKQLCDTDVILTSAVGATSGSVSANSFPCGDRVSGTLKALRYRSGDFQVQIG